MNFETIIAALSQQPYPSRRPLTGQEQLALSTYGDVLAKLFVDGLTEMYQDIIVQVADAVCTETCKWAYVPEAQSFTYTCGLTVAQSALVVSEEWQVTVMVEAHKNHHALAHLTHGAYWPFITEVFDNGTQVTLRCPGSPPEEAVKITRQVTPSAKLILPGNENGNGNGSGNGLYTL